MLIVKFCWLLSVMLFCPIQIVFGGTSEPSQPLFEAFEPIPAAYNGRFRPLSSISSTEQLWMGHFQKKNSLPPLIPSRRGNGEWLPIESLHNLQSNNFTLYPDSLFSDIQTTYKELEKAFEQWTESAHRNNENRVRNLSKKLSLELAQGYSTIAGTPYKQSIGRALFYPTQRQLVAEEFYTRYPLSIIAAVGYLSAFFLFFFSFSLGRTFLTMSFCMHTLILALRSYILERPPVSNMAETIVYVPWITIVASIALYRILKRPWILMTGTSIAAFLLSLLQFTTSKPGLENVPAVLNSQYWLIIHVLMVVGSYGLFFLSGIMGHIYAWTVARGKNNEDTKRHLSRAILYSMYIGLALLIPGTILGGVWAAESWGRFWDWDPKESWAFISICTYLVCIHAYTFHKIHEFGLAMGAILGLVIISFTWYGVNYILGTGLHSYGFGSGGERFYFLYLAIESAFLLFVWKKTRKLLKRSAS